MDSILNHPEFADRPAAEIEVGMRLRHARKTLGLKLREVADQAGCSESLVSKIENGRALPSLHLLHRLVEVLGLNIGQLFAKTNEPARVVSRSGERAVVSIDPLRQGSGIQLERLIPYDPAYLLQGSIHLIAPGAIGGQITHAGEEVGYVIEGHLELRIGDETYAIGPGDSFHFRSEIPHGYRNVGAETARIIFINTPPTF
jgi:transcriptional regulator with XRE-family HTH domain